MTTDRRVVGSSREKLRPGLRRGLATAWGAASVHVVRGLTAFAGRCRAVIRRRGEGEVTSVFFRRASPDAVLADRECMTAAFALHGALRADVFRGTFTAKAGATWLSVICEEEVGVHRAALRLPLPRPFADNRSIVLSPVCHRVHWRSPVLVMSGCESCPGPATGQACAGSFYRTCLLHRGLRLLRSHQGNG